MIKKISILFLILSTIGFSRSSEETDLSADQNLLSENDLIYAELDNQSPALRTPLSNGLWVESYNEWLCFPSKIANIETTVVDYSGIKHIPSLRIALNGKQVKIFDTYHDVDWNYEKILTYWREYIDSSDQFCIFAAYAQDVESEELYYIQKIKFGEFYWNSDEDWEN